MLKTDQSFVYAFFHDEKSAAAAVQRLIDSGFATEHIGALIATASGGVQELPLEHKTGIAPGAAIGAALGAAIGAIALPALGLVALGSGLAGAAAGGLTGTIAGTLGGLGLWKDEVEFPSAAFKRGDVLVGTLAAPERAEQASEALRAAGGERPTVSTQRKAAQELDQKLHAGRA
jgi:hypothetical protein